MHSTYNHPEYELEINPQLKTTLFCLTVRPELLYASAFPTLVETLTKKVLNIFSCECFNPHGNAFKKEVVNTETGHLFEHILLEFLCDEKLKYGYRQVEYNGMTQWNWKEEKPGVYNICIDVSSNEYEILTQALSKTLDVINGLIDDRHLAVKNKQISPIKEHLNL